MSWLLVFLGFCLLIMLHEAGHFVAAKATGMRVERFFLFFGPTIWSFKRGETEYGVKSIPLGGYVRITGMNPEEEIPPEMEHRAYYRQKVWKRIVVVAAGPVVNIVLAFAILFAVFSIGGLKGVSQEVTATTPGSPAAGVLQKGDKVVAIDGQRLPGKSAEDRIERWKHLVASHKCAGEQVSGCLAATPVRLTVVRDGRVVNFSVHPRYDAHEKRALIGFAYGEPWRAVSSGEAASKAGEDMWMVASKTASVFANIFNSEHRKEISGIVGTSDVGHSAVEAGWRQALLLLALVSLSLGLVNLLPILPLDGGHILWSLVEKLRGAPVSMRVMERASIIGFALVAMLFFIGLSNDIGRLTGEGFNVR